MTTCKADLLKIISRMPENVDIEELTYHVHLFEKLKKGQREIKEGNCVSIQNLKKEVQTW